MKIVIALFVSLAISSNLAQAAEPTTSTTGSTLMVIQGHLPLMAGGGLFPGMGGERTLGETCLDIRSVFKSENPNLVLDLTQGFMPGLAAAEELAITLNSRDEGITVTCLLENVDDNALIVAAACDEVLVADGGTTNADGLALMIDYYADMLGKIGVNFHAVTSGPEKTGPEPFTQSTPSEAALAEYTKLLDSVDTILKSLSSREGLSPEQIAEARESAPHFGADAVAAGIAHKSVFPGEYLTSFDDNLVSFHSGPELPDMSSFGGMMQMWTKILQGPQQQSHDAAVAVVRFEGMIVDGAGSLTGGAIPGHSAAALLDDLREREDIVAVVVRINSGGGSASASDRIYQAMLRLDASKPVIVLMDGAAASGGYYIACGARKILTHRSTITGSIGVFAMMPDLEETRKMMGINRVTIKRGGRSDLMATGAMTEEKREAIKGLIETIDKRFQGIVAERRNLKPEAVAALADGKVYLGDEALELGLADETGDMVSAVIMARTTAGHDKPLPMEFYPQPGGLAEILGLDIAGMSQALIPVGIRHFAKETTGPTIMAWKAIPDIR